MLSTFHQPSALGPAALLMSSPFRDFHWPVRSLWPETRPLFYQLEQEMVRHFQIMKQNMDYMDRLHQRIWEEIDQSAPAAASASLKPITFQMNKDQGGAFALTLNTKDYTPEELSVKQVGRKLRVSGRSERKQEVDSHSSYRLHEFRQEFELPGGVSPESVTCSLDGGLLCIQAPCEKDTAAGSNERLVPITVAPREQPGSTATPKTTTAGEVLSTTPCKSTAAGEAASTTPKTTDGEVLSTTPCKTTTAGEVLSTTPCKSTTAGEAASTTPCKSTTDGEAASTTPKTTAAGTRLVPITLTQPEELVSTASPKTKTDTN